MDASVITAVVDFCRDQGVIVGRAGGGRRFGNVDRAVAAAGDHPRRVRPAGGHAGSRTGSTAGLTRRGGCHAVQLHQRAGRVPLGAATVPRGEVAADRGAAADGDRGGLGARELARAQPAAWPHRRAHPGGLRRPGVRLRRAWHRAGGDGPSVAVRALFRLDRAGRDRDHECRHRGAEARAAAAASPPARRSRRWPSPSRTDGGMRRGDRDDGDVGWRQIPAGRREELRARRPHGRPDRRAGAAAGLDGRRRAVVLHRAWRCARADAARAEGDGPDAQAGAAGVPLGRGGAAGRGGRAARRRSRGR